MFSSKNVSGTAADVRAAQKPLDAAQQRQAQRIFVALKDSLEKIKSEGVPFAPFQWITENSKEDIERLGCGLGKSLQIAEVAGFKDMATSKYYPRQLLTAVEGDLIMKKLDYCAIVLASYNTMAENPDRGDGGGVHVFARFKQPPMLPKLVLGSIFEYQTSHVFVPVEKMLVVCENLVRTDSDKDAGWVDNLVGSLESAIAFTAGLAKKHDVRALLEKVAKFPGNSMGWLADEMAI